jgi:signal transduction histidine kinase
MRPVLWAVLVCTAIGSVRGHPGAGWSGVHLGVTISLIGSLLPMALAAAYRWPVETGTRCVALCVLLAGFGLPLAALQQNGISTLPASVAVMLAFLFLPVPVASLLGVPITLALFGVVLARPVVSVGNAFSDALFCAVLAVMAWCMRQAGQSSDRAELLLAQLEDAREAEAQAAVLAERTRIAQDLHDVLAQSLSGLAIQIEASRRVARRPGVDEDLRVLLDRSAALVKEGLSDARRAVGALRGDQVPALDRLGDLVQRYRDDLGLDVTLEVRGTQRQLSDEIGFALYRGAQEALTNAARYAHGARTLVSLGYEEKTVVLVVEDTRTPPGPPPAPVATGSGLGLAGMRERLAEVAGTVTAGPTESGWIVRMEVPA